VEFFPRPDGSPPVNGYSHAVSFSGPMVAISGQVPMDRHGRVVGVDDPPEQMRQVFRNLDIALRAAGSSLGRIVKLTVYLTDLNDLATFRQVRDEYLDPSSPPASSLIRVSGLVDPAFHVEIDALALA
jgi:enamine deaminase RidA (YjgF/YER057c/UK114 family)